MSFHFYLYRAPHDAGPMNEWTEMRAQPLGSAREVRDRLAQLYPQIAWTEREGTWSGLGTAPQPYLDVLLSEDEPGRCHFVVMNKAAPSVMRRVLAGLGLNHVFAPESGDMVDVDAYGDHDRHYARRAP